LEGKRFGVAFWTRSRCCPGTARSVRIEDAEGTAKDGRIEAGHKHRKYNMLTDTAFRADTRNLTPETKSHALIYPARLAPGAGLTSDL